jgi:endo-1,4-beta-xylanase
MVSFTAIVATALAVFPSVIAIPGGEGPVKFAKEYKGLQARQSYPWQWWTEGRGPFSCQQQGGGKYSCNWKGEQGGGMVAGTGWGSGRK